MHTCHRGDFVASHREACKMSLLDAERIHQTEKVLCERHPVVRLFCFGVTLSPASIGNDPKAVGECRGKIVVKVRIVT